MHNKSLTFPFENRVNVARIVVSPDGGTVLTIDEDGRALLVAAQRRTVLHHHSFKAKVGKMHIIYSLVWASCLGLVPSGLRLARICTENAPLVRFFTIPTAAGEGR